MVEYVFRDVNQIGEKEYQTIIDGQELAEMWRDCVYRNIRTAIPETSGHEIGFIRTPCRLT